MKYSVRNIIFGALIYAAGDTIASLIIGDFAFSRLLGIMLVGATFYAFEIPNYFFWISKRTAIYTGLHASMARTGLALLYFNPLWIARHIFFIKLFSFRMDEINTGIFYTGLISFLVNIPVSFLANFIIQNKIKVGLRFIASAIFSGLMAIYYALSSNWFI